MLALVAIPYVGSELRDILLLNGDTKSAQYSMRFAVSIHNVTRAVHALPVLSFYAKVNSSAVSVVTAVCFALSTSATATYSPTAASPIPVTIAVCIIVVATIQTRG